MEADGVVADVAAGGVPRNIGVRATIGRRLVREPLFALVERHGDDGHERADQNRINPRATVDDLHGLMSARRVPRAS